MELQQLLLVISGWSNIYDIFNYLYYHLSQVITQNFIIQLRNLVIQAFCILCFQPLFFGICPARIAKHSENFKGKYDAYIAKKFQRNFLLEIRTLNYLVCVGASYFFDTRENRSAQFDSLTRIFKRKYRVQVQLFSCYARKFKMIKAKDHVQSLSQITRTLLQVFTYSTFNATWT